MVNIMFDVYDDADEEGWETVHRGVRGRSRTTPPHRSAPRRHRNDSHDSEKENCPIEIISTTSPGKVMVCELEEVRFAQESDIKGSIGDAGGVVTVTDFTTAEKASDREIEELLQKEELSGSDSEELSKLRTDDDGEEDELATQLQKVSTVF